MYWIIFKNTFILFITPLFIIMIMINIMNDIMIIVNRNLIFNFRMIRFGFGIII